MEKKGTPFLYNLFLSFCFLSNLFLFNHVLFPLSKKEYNFLNDLHPDKDNWVVKVRVARIWESLNFWNNNALISLNMVLIDE